MLPPVRCYTCNNVIADKIIPLSKTNNKKIFFEQHVLKYCCRNILMTHVDIHTIGMKN